MQTLFNAPSTPLLPPIHSVQIPCLNLFHTITYSCKRCGAKQSFQPRHKNQLQFWFHQLSFLVNIWVELKWSQKETCMKYWIVLRYFIKFYFHLPVKFSKCLIFPIKCSVCIKRNLIVYRYIAQLISRRCFWKLYPELTQWLESFVPVSSNVPVCCIAIECNVMLCAVEYKKLRIRHYSLYAEMYTPQLFWIFHPFCLP